MAWARIDDRYLSKPSSVPNEWFTAPAKIEADELLKQPIAKNKFGVQLFVKKSGVLRPLPPMKLSLTIGGEKFKFLADGKGRVLKACARRPGASVRGSIHFSNRHFRIVKNGVYRLQFRSNCGKSTKLVFESTSRSGQVIGIWEVVDTAVKKFRAIGELRFWKNRIDMRWPERGNYYQYGAVYITDGDQWDVVGHELGHAIYEQARIGSFGSGPHYIDRCYRRLLAFSEGWASFFVAWLKLELDDPDAKFEFLVPSRAPIRVEHVPEDVCAGPTNEWRVFSFLWDLIDTNRDGENTEMSFKTLWRYTKNKGYRSIDQLARGLYRRPVGESVKETWRRNFLTSPPLRR